MIEAKVAVKIAIQYLFELYSSTGFDIMNILLEELTQDSYKDIPLCWYVTIGFNEIKVKSTSGLAIADQSLIIEKLFPNSHSGIRKFKTVIIDPQGKIQAMKIHEAEYAR